jgi:tetratricopeptide (TPR) repeat protein
MSEFNDTPLLDESVSTAESELKLVDEVVSVLTNPPSGEDGVVMGLKDQLQRAADEYDKRTAEIFGSALVDSLCEDPSDARRLEALLILGLAHPSILDLYQISLVNEGRRLCVLLENQGEEERARGFLEVLAVRIPDNRELQQDLASMMRRSGDVGELVDRCLKRAEEAVESGRPMDAIPWLQEVLLHDQTRRDVARMIRDLRYQEMGELAYTRKRNRMMGIVVGMCMILGALGVREVKLAAEFDSMPQAGLNDSAAINERIRGIDTMLASNRFWAGMFSAVGERNDLRARQDLLSAKEAREERRTQDDTSERHLQAESLRLKAIEAVRGHDYSEAKILFQRALSQGPDDWTHSKRILLNIAAIDEQIIRGD